MREVNLEEYSKERKANKIKMLKIRDLYGNRQRTGKKYRDPEKQIILYKMALRSKRRKFEKVNDREYNLKER